ncbi:MAG: trimethylamine methyltransferase family protein [Caldilineaceae bacterium]|nr:trimethylamine methyltransferase family protein [Caldilineaceae bacterium]
MSRESSHERRQARRTQRTPTRSAARQFTYNVPPYDPLSAQELQQIHDRAMTILRDFGIAFYDAEVREIFAAHGARVQGDMIYLDEATVMEYAGKAPAQFVQQARNPANNVIIGGNHAVFAPVYGPPFVTDLDWGRREATLEDFHNFVKLTYLSPWLHHSGGTVVEPNDEPVLTRHLDMLYSHIRYSDKPFMGSVTDPANAADSVAMAELLLGRDAIRQTPALLSLINVSSPRRYDDRMLGCMKVYARAGQAMIITPFLMAGAMSPASMAGTMALQNAEALAGIALCQMITPGLPVVYGSFMTNLDLQSGATVFGSPESQLTLLALAQLARRYQLPFRSGGTFTSAKLSDAQAGYEATQVMSATAMGQVNFVLHAAGWLESGLAAGYEKFILDCEVLGMVHAWARGIDLSDEAFALDALEEVPPGGHFLGTDHTMRNFRTAFYRGEMFDYNAYEQWLINGGLDARQRANARWKAQLAAYEAPPLDPSIDVQLQEFMRARKRELGFEA